MQSLRPNGKVDVKILDIWTEYGVWPYNKMAAGYPFLCAQCFAPLLATPCGVLGSCCTTEPCRSAPMDMAHCILRLDVL